VRPHLQNNQSKKGWSGMAQGAEHLPSKHKALCSNTSTAKKKREKLLLQILQIGLK
jgi:hypothetical protein